MKRILFVLLAAAATAQADIIANWRFDDGTPPAEAAALVTQTNAPTLNGTATQNESGPKPTFSADRPGDRVWSSFSGPLLNSANTASLRFVNAGLPGNTNSNSGGAVTVPDNDPLLRPANLTVEAFIKVDRRVNFPLIVGKVRSGGTSWNFDFNNAGQPRVRIDSQPVGEPATTGTPGFNQSWTATQNIEDGQWHHVAFTYTHATRMVDLFVDYVRRGGGQSAYTLVYDTGQLRIGQGAGGRAFDGWIDEIRISDTVLHPSRFMTVTEPASTRVYLPFEDGPADTLATVVTNTFYAPLLHGTAGTIATGPGTPSRPAFSTARPPATTARIADGVAGPVVNLNAGSLRFVNAGLPGVTNSASGGVITLPGASVPAQTTNFTAEAFIRVDRHVDFGQIFGKVRAGGLSWSLAVAQTGYLRARFDSQIPPADTGFNQAFNTTGFVEDGRWHHVALTYDYPTRTVRIYQNYEQVGQGVTVNPLWLDSGDIQLGAGDRAFDGWIDEFRLTDRVLQPDAFLRVVQREGTAILVL